MARFDFLAHAAQLCASPILMGSIVLMVISIQKSKIGPYGAIFDVCSTR